MNVVKRYGNGVRLLYQKCSVASQMQKSVYPFLHYSVYSLQPPRWRHIWCRHNSHIYQSKTVYRRLRYLISLKTMLDSCGFLLKMVSIALMAIILFNIKEIKILTVQARLVILFISWLLIKIVAMFGPLVHMV